MSIFTSLINPAIIEIMNKDTVLFEKFGRIVEPGKMIFKEGEEGDKMFIIQKGKVKITKNVAGKEHTLAVLAKGDFFGEMAIVNLVKRTANASAIDCVELLTFDRLGFLNMITKNAKIALNIIDKLCRRLQNANLQIQHLVRKNGKGLVALYLMYAFKSVDADENTIQFDRTVEEISLNLEFPNENVKAIFDQFFREGILSTEGNRLQLLDRDKLSAIAESLGRRNP